MELRPYQKDCINNIRKAYASGKKSIMFYLPCAGGKTVLFTEMAKGVAAKGGKTLIITHRNELLLQACEKLRSVGMEYGVISANATMDLTRPTQVASVDTIVRRFDKIKAMGWEPTFVIQDEAHHVQSSNKWGKVFENFPNAKRFGCTASPCRTDGGGFDDVFDDLVCGPGVKTLTDQGFLSPIHYYAPPMVASMEGVRKRMGDFAQDDLDKAMDKATIHGDAVAHYARICPHTPAIAFCVSVAHAEHVAEAFRQAGFKSASIDGNMDMGLRSKLLNDLANGGLDVLTSCALIGEGLDIRICGCVIMLRPTESLSLFIQMIGRPQRLYPGKTHATVLDHVNNIGRHGMPCADREWSLQGKGKDGGGKREGPPPPITCTGCYRQIVRPLPPCCPYCKEDLTPIGREEELKQVAGELKKLEAEQVEAMRKTARKEQGGAQTMADLIKLAHSRGYKSPNAWAAHIFNGRQNRK